MNKTKIVLLMFVVLLAAGGGIGLWRHFHGEAVHGAKDAHILYYYCPMHPDVRKDVPGKCPICNMDLVPKEKAGDKPSTTGERKVRYWVDSMNPNFKSDKPGKAPDGMDLVPVYEEETADTPEIPEALKGLAPINLTTYKQQLIGVKLATAAKRDVTRTVSTVGRASDLGGGLVADVYALDIPFVKQGQKAWVSSFSGSGARIEGVVSGLFPYDDTQSRVRRARIAVKARLSSPYANVSIETGVPSRLAVPADAVMETGSHTYVFVQAEPGHFIPREVTVGAKGDSLWEVIGGLKEGEQVVSGANFLVDADSRLSAILNQ